MDHDGGTLSLYHRVARHVMAPVLDLARGCGCMPALRELEDSQWWPRDRIDALQRGRLQETIRHAYAHVPYYRRVMRERAIEPQDIGAVADLSHLPILTKAIVRENLHDLTADDARRGDLIRSRTSGSTGSPLVFLTTKQDWHGSGQARGLLAMEWAGVKLGDRTVAFTAGFGAPTPLEQRIRPVSSRLRRATIIPLSELSTAGMDEVVRTLRRVKPRAIEAYPSALALIAAHIRDSGKPAPGVYAILIGGEQVFEHQRSLIREVFGKEPFSRYGSHENYLMGTECEAHAGFHVFSQDLVLEIVAEDGSPVAPGVEGRVLVTNLRARGMPFIRYDTGDIGAYATTPCVCGRGMPLLDHLSGRRCDTIYTRDGRRIPGTGVGLSRFALLGATGVQLVQEDLDHLTARVVVPEAATPEEREAVRRGVNGILHASLGPCIALTVELLDHIEPSPAGKYVPVISKVDPDSWLNQAGRVRTE